MDVYLFRHGEALPVGVAGSDAERKLTEGGRRDVQKVARAAGGAGVQPDLLLTSPLVRARQTAELLAEVFGIEPRVEPRLASGWGLADLRSLVEESGAERVMLVAHEPDLSLAVRALMGGGYVKMSSAGLAHVSLEAVKPGNGVLMWLLAPACVPE